MAGRALPIPILLLALVVAILGALVTPFAVQRDEASRAWLTGQLGGSALYALNVGFARVLPFLVAGGILLALWQRLRGRSEDRTLNGEVLRHDRSVVVTHWLNTLGMVLGLVSAAFLLRWLDRGLPLHTIYILHFVGSGLVILAVAHHLTYHGIGGGRGLIPRSRAEIKQALAELLGYAGVFARQRAVFGLGLPTSLRRGIQRPLQRWGVIPGEEDKYLATEKVLSYPVWVLLIGVLVVTGIIKSLQYLFPMPGLLLQGASWLHGAVTIWVVIWLAAHVAPVVLVPRNWPLFRSMLSGRISGRYVEQHFPLWYQRLSHNPDPEASERALPQR